jgi:hypothetical protein
MGSPEKIDFASPADGLARSNLPGGISTEGKRGFAAHFHSRQRVSTVVKGDAR